MTVSTEVVEFIKQELAHLKELVWQRFASTDKALELQAQEYERRLEDLNHAHSQAQARNADYLPRNVFEQTVAAWSEWRQTVETRITSQPSPENLEARLKSLEVAHAAVASEYVSQEKYEDKLHSESEARAIALTRLDERFEEHVKRWEQRDREVALLLAAQKGATEEAQRIAEEQGRNAVGAAEEQGRKNNRDIGIASVLLTAVIVAMNLIGAI